MWPEDPTRGYHEITEGHYDTGGVPCERFA